MKTVLIYDMWDDHWDKRTVEYLDDLAEAIQRYIEDADLSIHGCFGYGGSYPSRKYERVDPPSPFFSIDPEGPQVWTAPHPGIKADYTLDDARTIFSLLEDKDVEEVELCGVHLDMCVLNRNYGAQNLREYGFRPVILTDLSEPLVLDKQEVLDKLSDSGYEFRHSTNA